MTNDQLPQLRVLSTNICPNARPRAITELSMCDQWALTTWGYCRECFECDRVPPRWLLAIDAEMAQVRR